jgi:hypothetical protein
MGDCWKTIEGDDGVLSLNDYNILKIGKYRHEICEQFQSIAQSLLSQGKQQIALAKLAQAQTVTMQFQQIDWICSPSEGIDCEILFLGEKNWQKGKLRIRVSIEFPEISIELTPINDIFLEEITNKNKSQGNNFIINVSLEFMAIDLVSPPVEKTESVFSQEALQSTIELEQEKSSEKMIASPHLFTFKNNN